MNASTVTQYFLATQCITEASGVCYVINTIGSSCTSAHAALLDLPNSSRHDFDCNTEQQKRAAVNKRLLVHALNLGDGHTLRTLFANCEHPAASIIDHIADMDATDGCGASPAVGFRSANELIATDDFQKHLLHIRDRKIIQTNGAPCRLFNLFFISTAGGTGSGAVEPIAIAYEDVTASLGIPVTTAIYALGGITFTGVSEFAPLNSACVTASLVDFVTRRSRHPNVSRCLYFTDLPPVEDDSESREQLIGLDYQALCCNSLSAYMRRSAPNNAAAGPLGNINYRSTAFRCGEISNRAIQASCAQESLYRLKPLLVQAKTDMSLVKELIWTNQSDENTRLQVNEIIANPSFSIEQMIEFAEFPLCKYDYSLLWNMGYFGQFDLSEADHCFAITPTTSDEIAKRKLLFATFEAFIEKLTSELELANEGYRAEIANAKQFILAFTGRRSRFSFRRELNEADLVNALEAIRSCKDEFDSNMAKLATLKLGFQLIIKEREALNAQLNSVERCLKRLIATLGPQSQQSLVVANSLDKTLPILLTLPELSNNEQKQQLYRLAYLLTLDGLQLVTGAASPRIEQIADEIVFGSPDYVSPPMGARHRTDRPATLYVLPTLEAQSAQLLKKQILIRNSNASVFFTDSIAMGAAVVSYQLRTFPDVESLFPGILRHDLVRAVKTDTAQLRFPNGTDCLKRLGIRIDGETDKIHFDSPFKKRFSDF